MKGFRWLCAAVLVFQAGAPVFAQDDHGHKHGTIPNLDIRVNPTAPTIGLTPARTAQAKTAQVAAAKGMTAGLASLKAAVAGAEATLSSATGSVEVVSATHALTDAAPGKSGFDIVRDFLTANAALYGLAPADLNNLRFIGESVSPGSGLRMVRVDQVINGCTVFQSETRFIIDKDGRLIRSVGLLVPNASAAAPAPDFRVSAQDALVSAMASVEVTLNAGAMTLANTQNAGKKTEVVANDPQIEGVVKSEIVYFPLAPGVLVAAWSQVAMTHGEGDFYTLVDASNGQLLWRKNIRAHLSTEQARFSVYVQADGKTPADSPSPLSPTTATLGASTQPPSIPRTNVSMSVAQNIVASQNGWITDGGNTTTGNNVDAYLDTNSNDVADPGVLDFNGRPVGNVDAGGKLRDFLGTGYAYDPPPFGGNPEAGTAITDTQFKRGVVTQLFYVTNWYHDQLYALGFDEAAGNFQSLNFTGQGLAADAVLAEAQDAATNGATGNNRNNANFSTPPDGQAGRMQMYIFDTPTLDRDGSLDSEIVIHELTHGLSNRLIGNGSGLIWDVGGGMGEGWSDFYALSLLNNTNADDPNGRYASGAYATYKLANATFDNYVYGIRRFPYCTDNSVNPLTWGDVDDITLSMSGGIATSPIAFSNAGGAEVHNIGEIWTMTLWEVRSRVIADPAGANGNVPMGNQKMLQLITDSLKMTPASPSFIDARDAIIAADMATNAGANEKWIWQGFADRGLGYNAVAPFSRLFGFIAGHVSIGESFDVPYLDVQAVAIDDSIGNNNGAIDPNEPVKINVTLKNPWRSGAMTVSSATATLTCSTPGVTITDGSSAYPTLAPQGTAMGDSFQFTVPLAAYAGQALDFTITVNSTLLGTKAVNFKLRVGTPSGVGAPITYLSSPNLAIPDNNNRGVSNGMTITDDFEIADLNFRVDNLTHTFPGDLSVLLRGPNGLGVDLITALGGALSGGGDGDNIVNMVVDDAGTGDILLAPNAQAPYTGNWKPVFNSPTWAAVGFPAAEPMGTMSRYNGLSTLGTWRVLAADQANFDAGTLTAWSLIVTPKAYTATPFGDPEIKVEVGGGTDVPNNSTQNFTANVTSSVSVPYTIKNTGASPLTGLTYSIDGMHASMFSVTNAPVAPVAANGSTVITITFQPTATGMKSAAIHINNNDTDENPFNIILSGSAGCPTITVTNPAVTSATLGYAFNQTFTRSGGYGGATFTTASTLPTGLLLAPSGVLSGVPTQTGTFPIIVTVTDSAGCTGTSATYNLTINPVVATLADLKITEIRGRGLDPLGLTNDYVEIYNASPAALTVMASDASAGVALVASDGGVRFVIPNGTVIPGNGHYLGTGSTYALGAYGASDITFSSDLPMNMGVALFSSSSTFTLATRLDAVGPTSEANTLYKEGTGYGPVTNFNFDYAIYRFPLKPPAVADAIDPTLSLTDGQPRDTDNNATDFVFVDTLGTSAGFGQRLGAPGPEGLGSPRSLYPYLPNMGQELVDPDVSASTTPNMIRDLTSVPAQLSSQGNLQFCRTFTNETGAPMTVLRFRIIKITTFPAPASTADLRPISSANGTVTTQGGPVTVVGATLDEPPGQSNGGGWNTTFKVPTIAFGTPLANGASVNVKFTFGVQQTGTFRFALLAEASPAGASHLWFVSGNTESAASVVEHYSGEEVDEDYAEPYPYKIGQTQYQATTDEPAPNGSSNGSIGTFELMRRGGAISENGEVVFPAELTIGSGSPQVTINDFQGMFKGGDGSLALLARSGSAAPGTTGAVFDVLPEVPAISTRGIATFYASLRLNVGDATSSNDTGVWSEGSNETLALISREGDAVPGIGGAFIDHFATGVFATAQPVVGTYSAAFPVVMRGSTTTSAMLLVDKTGAGAPSASVIAQEGTSAPGTGENFGFLASAYSDPARMDPQGNVSFGAILKPSGKDSLWYKPRGAALTRVFSSGDTAPGTSGATFTRLSMPAKGSSGKIAFQAYLSQTGDNSANLKNDGIWFGDTTGGFACIIRRGDSGLTGMPPGSKVGNLWSGWLNGDNNIALRGWVDMNGDGNSAAPTDVHGIYTNTSGSMELLVKVGDPAAEVPDAIFTGMDLPVIGPNGIVAFIGTVAGTGITAANNTGVWTHVPGGSLDLVLRTGDTVNTLNQGGKTVQKIDFPGTSQGSFTTDHRWEQPVLDEGGNILLNVIFTDGTSSQMLAQ